MAIYAALQARDSEGAEAAAFLLGYGIFRFVAEYFREPDAHLGLLSMGLSMGQWLCVPMILGGIGLWVWADRQPKSPVAG
jgi:phosphatidylglycerol:prolipoprotein diacylglycerol transferase